MHSKGLATRRRIIDQTVLLLRNSVAGKISAADVARACGLTPPALYLYFDGVPEIILARLAEIDTLPHSFLDALDNDCTEDQLFEQCRKVMHAYAEYWREFDTPLQYRNMMSEHGDKRFRDIRVSMLLPIRKWLYPHVERAHQNGLVATDVGVESLVSAGVMMIDTTAALSVLPSDYIDAPYWDPVEMIDVTANMVYGLMGGRFVGGEPQVPRKSPAQGPMQRFRIPPEARPGKSITSAQL